MGTVPTPTTYTAGASLAATSLNNDRDVDNYLLNLPACYAYNNGGLTMTTSGTFYLVPLDAEVYEVVQSGDAAMHDNTTNNSRIVARTSGKWRITASMEFTSNATGGRTVELRKNAAGVQTSGTLILTQSQNAVSGTVTSVLVTGPKIPLTAGDYIEAFVRQQSGGSLTLSPGQAQCWLSLEWAGI